MSCPFSKKEKTKEDCFFPSEQLSRPRGEASTQQCSKHEKKAVRKEPAAYAEDYWRGVRIRQPGVHSVEKSFSGTWVTVQLAKKPSPETRTNLQRNHVGGKSYV